MCGSSTGHASEERQRPERAAAGLAALAVPALVSRLAQRTMSLMHRFQASRSSRLTPSAVHRVMAWVRVKT